MKKVLLFCTLTLFITGCSGYLEKQENIDNMVEYINLNSYENKPMYVDSLTNYEL